LKPPKRYKYVKAGEWVQPKTKGYRLQCCDCGLVHKMEFRVMKGLVQLRAWRAALETRRVRMARGITFK